jgi:hypothetical protein
MLDLVLERMWRLPARQPRPARAAWPPASRIKALDAERRQLNVEARCYVCRGVTGSRKDRCWVTPLGAWCHFPGDGSTDCWEFLQAVGKDTAGKWRPRWQVLEHVAATWR